MNEFVTGTPEGIDILIIVADRKNRQSCVLVLRLAPGQSTDESILPLIDILILINQDMAVAC